MCLLLCKSFYLEFLQDFMNCQPSIYTAVPQCPVAGVLHKPIQLTLLIGVAVQARQSSQDGNVSRQHCIDENRPGTHQHFFFFICFLNAIFELPRGPLRSAPKFLIIINKTCAKNKKMIGDECFFYYIKAFIQSICNSYELPTHLQTVFTVLQCPVAGVLNEPYCQLTVLSGVAVQA